jgi:hypothetical protein
VPLYLEEKVNLEEKKSWATPQQRDFKDAEPLSKWTERAEEQKAKGVNLHLPLPSQVMHTEEKKAWGTPSCMDTLPPRSAEALARAKLKGGCKNLREEVHQWATPRANKVHPEITEDNRDHLANRNKSNLEEEIAGHCGKATGKLNSQWVSQLMGLNMGWVSPSCPASVITNWPKFVSGWSKLTIELTNCDSSATELSQPQQREHLEFYGQK